MQINEIKLHYVGLNLTKETFAAAGGTKSITGNEKKEEITRLIWLKI